MKDRRKTDGPHQHCDKCYNTHCQAPALTSVSCSVVKCRNKCGLAFHACKEEEHRLLCPNETVPCLNVSYGCPQRMLRHGQARHLEVCPASVVCCSQEWNRWPVSETDLSFYRNVSEAGRTEQHLDVAAALRDQDVLFRSIKMKSIFPELTREEAALHHNIAGVKRPAEEAACSSNSGGFAGNSSAGLQETAEEKTQGDDVGMIQNFDSWEKIFSKEMGGCKETVKNVNIKEERGKEERRDSANCQGDGRKSYLNGENAVSASSVDGATGLAPWQDGVLERLGKEANIAEYNMYLVHHGAMLINFGQLAACTPREKDFVYGNLEPIEIQTVRTFHVPTSYRAKRIHLKDPGYKAETKHIGLDTSDLGLSLEELPNCHEVTATLLCSLEKEFKGHIISESKGTDGLYVDVGTQTFNFSSAPFETDASLADVVRDKPRDLYMQLEVESVTRRHNRTSSAFSYMCGRFFRRDEYRSHFKNVHSDIQASLNGWLQQRCPLAYLGCTFNQTRLRPTGQPAAIKYSQEVSAFVLQPQVPSCLCEDGKPQSTLDLLSELPLEILQLVAGYLDSFTLSQLSRVSRLMRELCATLLQDRGMVSLRWEKKTCCDGRSYWGCQKKVWEFSTLFSSVDAWSFSGAPSMSDHLRSCSFYQTEERTAPVLLACLGEVTEKRGAATERR